MIQQLCTPATTFAPLKSFENLAAVTLPTDGNKTQPNIFQEIKTIYYQSQTNIITGQSEG